MTAYYAHELPSKDVEAIRNAQPSKEAEALNNLSDETIKAMKEARRDDLASFVTVDELMDDLNKDD